MKKRIIIAVTNDLVTDQRINRIAHTLSEIGFEIYLIGRKKRLTQASLIKFNHKLFNLTFNKGALFYAEFNARLFFKLLFSKFDYGLSNDADTLLGMTLALKIRRKNLFFDTHEYFTELPELVNRNLVKKMWQDIEKTCIPQASICYTVCQSIANIYSKEYHKHFEVIRNVPFKLPTPEVRFFCRKRVVIYQGALNIGRGIELMIESMKYVPDAELWIVGSGDIEADLHQLTEHHELKSKVIFLGRLNYQELIACTKMARVGLTLEEDLGLNYRYALPNKLFDYVQARIPVIASDLPEMKQVVEQYHIGRIMTERSPIVLSGLINYLFEMPMEDAEIMLNNLEQATQELCWDNEKAKLEQLYNPFL